MSCSDQDVHDQRENARIEESNLMTIEFLRARLLSERTISKNATQRANKLAERVAELEEQLRVVSFQRLKAEKATSNVLSILKQDGLSEVSESVELISEDDKSSECRMSNKSAKEDKTENHHSKKDSTLTSSESESTSNAERILSWRTTKDDTNTSKRFSDLTHKRSHSVSSISSAKLRPSKSCRQIRRRNATSEDESVATIGDKKEENKNIHQNLFIDYEAIERAQREWEAKYTEFNNTTTPDSDVTEEITDIRKIKKKIQSCEVDKILNALKQAKQCLKQKIENSRPSLPLSPSIFKLPTDYIIEENEKASGNIKVSGSRQNDVVMNARGSNHMARLRFPFPSLGRSFEDSMGDFNGTPWRLHPSGNFSSSHMSPTMYR